MARVGLFWLIACLLANPFAAFASDSSPVAECDRLAAEPSSDGSGVPLDRIDAAAASEACAAAIEADPATPRLKHEYARALERAGNIEAAKRLYRWAADDGLDAARQALARLAVTASAANPAHQTASSPAGDGKLTAFIARVGDDPEALSEALSKDIAFEIYRGALRRPAMTLYLRSGNAIDQARLLAALIRKTHPDTESRFARCTLKVGIARTLVRSALTAKPTRTPLVIEQVEEAAKSGATDRTPAIRRVLQAIAATWRDLTTTAERESTWLADTLETHGVNLHPIGEDELIARARNHLWVQVKDGDRWLNLDPAMKRPLDPAGDCDGPVTTPGSIDDLEYTLTVELVRDERENGAIVPHSQLKKSLPFSAIPPTGLSLVFAEPWGIDPPENAPESDDRSTFLYSPVVFVGSDRVFGKPFTLPRPGSAPNGVPSVSTDTLGGALAAFSDEAGSLQPAPGEKMSTVALRLIATLSGPGMKPEQLQQVIFDRRANDEGGDPDAQSMVSLPEVGGEYAVMAAVTNISAAMGTAPADIALPDKPDDATLRHATFTALGALNSRYEAIRQAIFAATNDLTAPTITTAPSLSILQWSPQTKEGGSPALQQSVNVLRAGDGVLPSNGDLTLNAARWAVASVLAERLLANSAAADQWFEPGVPPPVRNDIIALFKAARDARAPVAFVNGNSSAIDDLEAPGVARRLMRERLAQGNTLLLPKVTPHTTVQPRLAWWIADEAHGFLFDEFADGTHVSMAASTMMAYARQKWRQSYCYLQSAAGAAAMVATMTLAGPLPTNSITSPPLSSKVAKAGSNIITSIGKAEEKRKALEQAGKAVCQR